MQDDLVERLRRYGFIYQCVSFKNPMAEEAADTITALRAELAKARRDALEEAARVAETWDGPRVSASKLRSVLAQAIRALGPQIGDG